MRIARLEHRRGDGDARERSARLAARIDAERVATPVGQLLVDQVTSRLNYLERVGVGHLAIERSLRTLSGGEAQRVALTAALGSNLTGMLYVLDEPSAGLHPADLPRLVEAVRGLRDRGNTVALVEHEPSLIQAADHVVEMGPGAGEFGGKVIFQGSPAEMLDHPESRTGEWLAGRRIGADRGSRRATTHGWLKLVGARGNNLQNVIGRVSAGRCSASSPASAAPARARWCSRRSSRRSRRSCGSRPTSRRSSTTSSAPGRSKTRSASTRVRSAGRPARTRSPT